MGTEAELEHELRECVRRCKELAYNPAYFVRMLDDFGALETARRLVMASSASEGFSRLWELGHLELTVEAVVLRHPYCALFTQRELDAARRRLRELGYSGPGMDM